MTEQQVFTDFGSEKYAAFTGSGGYRVSILGITKALVPFLSRLDDPAKILEVGGGVGKSAQALGEALRLNGITGVEIVVTEKDESLLRQASNTIPRVQNIAEALPIADKSVDCVVSSQVVHWIVSQEKLRAAFSEAHRVLKVGGMFVQATSGITDLGKEMNHHHFTQSPFVQEAYLPALERQLIAHEYWDHENDGVFEPKNPRVNPRYYRFTLDTYRNVLSEAGFTDVGIRTYMFPCNSKEMESRLCTNFSALEMHFFQSRFMKLIPQETKMEMAKAAFNEAKQKAPRLWALFDEQPLDVTVEHANLRTFGEPVPVISATK